MSTEGLSDKKIFVFGLMMDCPQGQPLATCPFKKYRKLSIIERIDCLENISDKEIDKMIKHHYECLWIRIKDSSKKS